MTLINHPKFAWKKQCRISFYIERAVSATIFGNKCTLSLQFCHFETRSATVRKCAHSKQIVFCSIPYGHEQTGSRTQISSQTHCPLFSLKDRAYCIVPSAIWSVDDCYPDWSSVPRLCYYTSSQNEKIFSANSGVKANHSGRPARFRGGDMGQKKMLLADWIDTNQPNQLVGVRSAVPRGLLCRPTDNRFMGTWTPMSSLRLKLPHRIWRLINSWNS